MRPLQIPSVGLLLVVAVLAGCEQPNTQGAPTQPSTDPAADRAAVLSAVEDHWRSINAGDSLKIVGQHSPELTVFVTEVEPRAVFPSAEADQFLSVIRGGTWQTTVSDLQVQMYGDVGVATFYLTGSFARGDGRTDTRRRRVTEVWVRQAEGSWKEAHHHDSVFAAL